MIQHKKNVIHFHNGSGGGVLSVINSLCRYSRSELITNHVIFTINKNEIKDFVAPILSNTVSSKVFYYSPDWNFYYTIKKLKKLLPAGDSIIVAHDWLELGMMSNLGLSIPVVHFLHGDYSYYYDLAVKNSNCINLFICVSDNIHKKLLKALPDRKRDCLYLRFPVDDGVPVVRTSEKFAAIFVGRLSNDKGYNLIPAIATNLIQQGVQLEWHIVGAGDHLSNTWNDLPVKFYGEINNTQLLILLNEIDFIILPSLAEGMPVSIIEAMKAGLIPLVNNIDGGIQELVMDGCTGFKIRDNAIKDYVEILKKLMIDSDLRNSVKNNSKELATQLFDPIKNTKLIEEKILAAAEPVCKKTAKKTYGSRLDQPWLPNALVSFCRRTQKRWK